MTKTLPAKISSCSFIGSFFNLNQIPQDHRPQVAFAGRSNVGKSSLLNRLVGSKKMAKVSTTPGKTRSLNFFLVNDQYYLVDLPGYGYAKVSKAMRRDWGDLIEAYLRNSENLVGLVLLLDCRREPTPEDHQLLNWLGAAGVPALIAITKTDKLNHDKANRKVLQVERDFKVPAIGCSSVTGVGKKELLGAVRNLIQEYNKDRRL
ncbi:MAG: YihA family ribosome biogenesis GTP-binding protein [Candidatus Zixiibacteriota bacterium]|nr:MAG: YihA family ribosome biogenesis GTP-binding protein [candidate division Zixibacteria bacterium]